MIAKKTALANSASERRAKKDEGRVAAAKAAGATAATAESRASASKSVAARTRGAPPTAAPLDPNLLESRAFSDAAAFDAWIAKNHTTSDGFWLELTKKAENPDALTYAAALEVALIWGWIDGQKRSKSATTWLQRFTPRRKASPWSQINRDKALALIAAGKMKPSGLAEVERAKADGRWDAAYAPPSKATVPDDLRAALDAAPRAAEMFATLNSANRFAILYRVQTAKRPETRAARIRDLVSMLARGEKLH